MLICLSMSTAWKVGAQERDTELDSLKRQMEELLRRNAEQQKQIETLQKQIESLGRTVPTAAEAEIEPVDSDDALEEALREIEVEKEAATETTTPAILSRRVGGAELRLIDISFDILTASGWSTEKGSSLRDLEGGAHDPNRRGFTLQQGELSLSGAVDPYFTGETHVIFGPDFIELEEAFLTTLALPYGLQLEAGYFFTEFGRINPMHPHAWRWIDQPVINTRMFGGDGLRSPGARVGWLTPLPWFSELHIGAQNADEGETTASFLSGEAVGGRPAVDRDVDGPEDLLYLTRWANSWDVTDELSTLLGFSGLFGPNSTGDDARTFVYGADLTMKWRPANNFRGWPFLEWQTEIMKRDYTADFFIAGTDTGGDDGGHGHTHGGEEEAEDEESELTQDLPGGILRDWGGYTQLLWGFRYPWAAGLRFEYASGRGESVIDGMPASREEDPFRDDRYRLSPLLIYHPSEFSRLRLQYNFDDAKHLKGDDAHSVWLGVEVLYGSHAAHKY
jgi:hypothetical protein